jgi:hypothetical protein
MECPPVRIRASSRRRQRPRDDSRILVQQRQKAAVTVK